MSIKSVGLVIAQVLKGEEETVTVGARLGSLLLSGLTLFLEGPLGAGKTTLTRGILNALGHSGTVKSPTYTLVEPYEDLAVTTYHFDLYRLGDPEELAYLGIRDYFDGSAICIVEWPDKGVGFLPEADIRLELQPQLLDASYVNENTEQGGEQAGEQKDVKASQLVGRKLTITATTEKGEQVLSLW